MAFERLPHVSPAAHRIFERSFHHLQSIAGDWFQIGYEHSLDGQVDPEYAESAEYRQLSEQLHATLAIYDEPAAAYRQCLGRWIPDHDHDSPF